MCSLEKHGRVFILRLTGDGEHRLNPTLIDSIQSIINQIRSDSSSSSQSVLITTADGKFFSNGYDFALAKSNPSLAVVMDSKLRSLVADLISLPMPTIAAVTGHASAAGFLLLSHDYILMRRDRGFLYMSELDVGLKVPTWCMAVIRMKINSPAAKRDVMLTGKKLTADKGLEIGVVDSAHDSATETVEAALKLGEELISREINGHVYSKMRESLLSEILIHTIGPNSSASSGMRNTRSKL